MGYISVRLGAAALLLSSFASPALAVERTCRNEIVSTGSAAIREPRAKEKAIEAWRGQAITNHGIFFGSADEANEGKGIVHERCARTLVGLWVCQARGRPCVLKATDQPNEFFCTSGDPSHCNPNVKWVQSRLNSNGAGIAVDGLEGRETADAIRRYKKSRNIGNDSYIDDRLLDALKG